MNEGRIIQVRGVIVAVNGGAEVDALMLWCVRGEDEALVCARGESRAPAIGEAVRWDDDHVLVGQEGRFFQRVGTVLVLRPFGFSFPAAFDKR